MRVKKKKRTQRNGLTKDIKVILYFNGSFHFIVVISIQQINRDIYPPILKSIFKSEIQIVKKKTEKKNFLNYVSLLFIICNNNK